jgi:hypothetical protein
MGRWGGKEFRPLARVMLVSSALVAGSISVLLDVPERVPFGHEAGFALSSLVFAYLGAWILNWVIVERPRLTERLRRCLGDAQPHGERRAGLARRP